jgi:hypothetical protein
MLGHIAGALLGHFGAQPYFLGHFAFWAGAENKPQIWNCPTNCPRLLRRCNNDLTLSGALGALFSRVIRIAKKEVDMSIVYVRNREGMKSALLAS